MIEIRRRTAEAVTAFALLGAVAFLFFYTFSFAPSPMRGYPGAAFMPRLVLIYTAIFLVIWLVRLLVLRSPLSDDADAVEEETFLFEYRDYLFTIAAVLAFVIGLERVGFEITCFVVLGLLLYPRLSSLPMTIFASAATVLFIYFTFVLLLNVTVPLLFLPSYISF